MHARGGPIVIHAQGVWRSVVTFGAFAMCSAGFGCTGTAPAPTTDLGTSDRIADAAVAPDAGSSLDVFVSDNPMVDAPTGMDTAADVVSPDASRSEPDAVPDGASTTDASVLLSLQVPCADTPADVYVTPAGLPVMTLDHRGDVVRCTVDPAMDVTAVQAALAAEGDEGVTAANGVDIYRIAFRTYRNTYASGISSARVYLPHGVTGPRPLVVAAHPSEGMAASCATSKNPLSLIDLALPWAALGHPVIAPDYAGLGTDGTQGYLDNGDTARSLLDGARALRRMLPPGALSDQIVLAGHSQGGGAVLSAQSLVRGYGADGTVVAAVVFAPEWPSRLDSFQLVHALSQPTTLTIAWGITTPVVVSLMAYAYFENHVGVGTGLMAFPPAQRAGVSAALNSLCLTPYGGVFQGLALHVSDWLEPTLRAGFVACAMDPTSSGCTGTGEAFFAYVSDNAGLAAGGDPLGAPIFYAQGMADIIMPPAQEAACNMDRLHASGASVELCTDDIALHTNVVQRNVRHAMAWVHGVLTGVPYPPCMGPALPPCTP